MSDRKPFEPTGSTIEITLDQDALVWSLNFVDFTPPSVEGGDPIDTTVLKTVKYKTKMAPTLIDMGNIPFTAELQPDTILTAPINMDGLIKITIPDEGELKVRGYLQNIKPEPLKIGERAMCSGEFVVTNTAADGFTEVAPIWTDAAGVTPTYMLGNLTVAKLQAILTGLGGVPGAMTATELQAAIYEELAG